MYVWFQWSVFAVHKRMSENIIFLHVYIHEAARA